MESVLLATLMIVVIAMVIVILLQQSEGGALGIGGGPGGMMNARGAADFLSKVTKWLAIAFFLNVLALGWLSANRDKGEGVLDRVQEQADQAPTEEEVPEGR